MKHSINFLFEQPKKVRLGKHLSRCILATLEAEGVTAPCEINVLVTDDPTIQEINRKNRDIDRPTDVLSFPMFEYIPEKFPKDVRGDLDPETGKLPLGDIVISLDRAEAQAAEYGHSLMRESGYLTIHSVLHLLGYDHVDESSMKQQMRKREEAILAIIALKR